MEVVKETCRGGETLKTPACLSPSSNNPLSVWLLISALRRIEQIESTNKKTPGFLEKKKGCFLVIWMNWPFKATWLTRWGVNKTRHSFYLSFSSLSAAIPPCKNHPDMHPASDACPPPLPPRRLPLCHHMAGISRFPRDHWRMSSEHLCSSFSLSFALRRVARLMHCNGWPLFTQGINKEKRGIDGVIHSRSH